MFFDYQYYLFDLWGVIHDGSRLYPHCLDLFEKLHQNGKKIGFISNAPRRAQVAKQTLLSLGVQEQWISCLVTSGETFYSYIKNNYKHGGEKIFYLGPVRDLGVLDGLNCNVIRQNPRQNPQDASFGIITGFGDGVENDDNLQKILQQCKNANLKLFCINPDLVVVKQDGSRFECAGVIANIYTQMGGQIEYFGKPFANIYDKIFEEMQISQEQKNVVIAIGDSLSTDVMGANNYGIDVAFSTYGIHKSQIANHKKISEFFTLHNITKTPQIVFNSMMDLL